MAKNPKKKKQLVDKQIELIDKQIKAVPRILTDIQIQNLLLEREKLVLSKQDIQESEEKNSGITPGMGLKAMGAAALFGGDAEMSAAVALLAIGAGKKVFRGLSKKKNEKEEYQEEEEIPQGEVQKPKAPKRVRKPKSKIAKPGFLMSAEDKIRARAERINSEENASKGTPEKLEADGKSVSSDNSVIISILNKILGSFENDNERMRRSIRDAEEKKLESDPTPDTPGSPVKEGDDKKSGMNKLLMFGAIAGLLGLAYTFKDEIAKVLEPITDMLGITNPLKESDKEDYDFDIMDALGVTALMGMLGISAIPGKGVPPKASGAPGTPDKSNAGSNTRERHPAGAKNAAGKSIGGQFKTALPKEGITKLILKRVGSTAGKIIPGIGLALGLYDAYNRAMDGDVVGASIAAGAGAAGSIPGVGTGIALAAAAANIARDVYKEAYGVFPEADESGDVAKNLKSIMDETIGALTNKKPGPPMSDADKERLAGPLAAYAAAIDPKSDKFVDPKRRQFLVSNVWKASGKLGIPRDVVETELGAVRDSSAGIKADDNLKALQDSAASAKVESAAEAITAAPSSAGAGGGSSPAPEAAPASSGMPSASGSSGTPVASSPPPASETSGSAVTAATMNASEAQNSVTVLPPIVNNESNTMKSGNEDASKAQKMTMQVRLNDDVFRKAVESTAAVLKAA
jgi:hypothetical protein